LASFNVNVTVINEPDTTVEADTPTVHLEESTLPLIGGTTVNIEPPNFLAAF
jgi:hypothetical protein